MGENCGIASSVRVMAETRRMKRLQVFLCHAREDKPEVNSLYQRLSKDGVHPWLDDKNLIPGQNWRDEIKTAVQKSDVALICLSNASINKEGVVQSEIKQALDVAEEKPRGTIYIIPVRLEGCEVPKQLQEFHWVNLFDADGYENLMRALATRANSLGFSIQPTAINGHEVEHETPSLSEQEAAKKELIRLVLENPILRWWPVEAIAQVTALDDKETSDWIREMASAGEVQFTTREGQRMVGLTNRTHGGSAGEFKNTPDILIDFLKSGVIEKLVFRNVGNATALNVAIESSMPEPSRELVLHPPKIPSIDPVGRDERTLFLYHELSKTRLTTESLLDYLSILPERKVVITVKFEATDGTRYGRDFDLKRHMLSDQIYCYPGTRKKLEPLKRF